MTDDSILCVLRVTPSSETQLLEALLDPEGRAEKQQRYELRGKLKGLRLRGIIEPVDWHVPNPKHPSKPCAVWGLARSHPIERHPLDAAWPMPCSMPTGTVRIVRGK